MLIKYNLLITILCCNILIKYQGSDIIVLFRKATETYGFEEFYKFMVEIKNKSHDP